MSLVRSPIRVGKKSRKGAFIFIAFLLASCSISAAEWVSPTDIQFRNEAPRLYAKYLEAARYLDGWQGENEDLARANKLLTEIIHTDSRYAPPYRELARLYMKAGYIRGRRFKTDNLVHAESALLKAIEIAPSYAEAYVLLGHLYTTMKRYKDAHASLTKAEVIGTKTPWLTINRANFLYKTGKKELAFEGYMKAIPNTASDINAHNSALEGVIRYYVFKKQYDDADSWHRRRIEHQPDSAWARGNYASFLLFRRGDIDAAISNAEAALSLMDYGMARFVLGCALYTKWAMMKERGTDKALASATFDRAYREYPDIDRVIEKTSKYKHTQITASKLTEHPLRK